MDSVDAMEVGYRLGHLLENPPGCRLSDDPIGQALRVLLQGDTLHEVRDNVDLLWSVDQVVQLDDAWVLESLKHCDLTLGCLALHRVCKFVLLVDFHCILLLVSFVEAEADGCVRSLADDSADVIALELATCLRAR